MEEVYSTLVSFDEDLSTWTTEASCGGKNYQLEVKGGSDSELRRVQRAVRAPYLK